MGTERASRLMQIEAVEQVTARLDADVLAWLKAGGQGYQSRMNAILRRAMLSDREA